MSAESSTPARWRQLRGEVTSRAIPIRTVETAEGRPASVSSYRDRRQVALFLAHDGCVDCAAYGAELAAVAPLLGDAEAITEAIVLRGPAAAAAAPARGWIDRDGRWRASIADRLGFPVSHAALVLTDRYLAPRILSTSADAGGLITMEELLDWARFLALDCPECATALDWGD